MASLGPVQTELVFFTSVGPPQDPGPRAPTWLNPSLTIAKVFLLPQFVYIATVLDPSEGTYEQINRYIRNFVNTGSTLASGDRNWIHQDILYGSKAEGGFNFIDARNFFKSMKISWIKRYGQTQ